MMKVRISAWLLFIKAIGPDVEHYLINRYKPFLSLPGRTKHVDFFPGKSTFLRDCAKHTRFLLRQPLEILNNSIFDCLLSTNCPLTTTEIVYSFLKGKNKGRPSFLLHLVAVYLAVL